MPQPGTLTADAGRIVVTDLSKQFKSVLIHFYAFTLCDVRQMTDNFVLIDGPERITLGAADEVNDAPVCAPQPQQRGSVFRGQVRC